jgi:hypothetical protein
MNKWIEEGVFDALQRHYLKALVFSIFAKANDPTTLLESYTFKFTYPNTEGDEVSLDFLAEAKGKEQKKLSFMSKEEIQAAWCTMIRTLIALSHTLPPIPSKRYIAMRLFYYETTPEDYNPPGFSTADDTPDFEFIDESERIEIGGSVKTKFHTVSLRLDTAMPNYKQNAAENEVSNMSKDLIRGIVSAFENNEISAKTLADNLGIPPNDSRVIETIDQMIEKEFIHREKGKLRPIKTKENQEIFEIAKKKLD